MNYAVYCTAMLYVISHGIFVITTRYTVIIKHCILDSKNKLDITKRFLMTDSLMKLLSMSSSKINIRTSHWKNATALLIEIKREFHSGILLDKPYICFSRKQMYSFRILHSELSVMILRLPLWEDKADTILWLWTFRVSTCLCFVIQLHRIILSYFRYRGTW